MNRILVIGANGKVGRLLVKELLVIGKYVRVMLRDESQSEYFTNCGADVFLGDLEKDFTLAFLNIDMVVFTAGSGSGTGPDKTISIDQNAAIKSIQIAKRFKITRYIMVSAQGARNPEKTSAIQHYYKAKHIADVYLITSGLAYTIFRPGRLIDEKATGKIKLSDYIPEKGLTSRENLALAIAFSVDLSNLENKVVEIFDGEDAIQERLSNF